MGLAIPAHPPPPRSRKRNQKSWSSLAVAMVLSGSPTGVRAAPSPMAKQASTTMRTSSERRRRKAAINSTRTSAAMMAVMMLEASPRTAVATAASTPGPLRASIQRIPWSSRRRPQVKAAPERKTAMVMGMGWRRPSPRRCTFSTPEARAERTPITSRKPSRLRSTRWDRKGPASTTRRISRLAQTANGTALIIPWNGRGAGFMGVFTARAEFIAGVRDELPIVVGVVPFGMIYGALAVGAGMPPAVAQATSIVIFAGSAQFLTAQLVGIGAPAAFNLAGAIDRNLQVLPRRANAAPYLRPLRPL